MTLPPPEYLKFSTVANVKQSSMMIMIKTIKMIMMMMMTNAITMLMITRRVSEVWDSGKRATTWHCPRKLQCRPATNVLSIVIAIFIIITVVIIIIAIAIIIFIVLILTDIVLANTSNPNIYCPLSSSHFIIVSTLTLIPTQLLQKPHSFLALYSIIHWMAWLHILCHIWTLESRT